MPEEARAKFNELMDAKDAILALLDPILAQMEVLRLSTKENALAKTAPAPSVGSSVIRKEIKVSNPPGTQRRDTKTAPPVAPTTKVERRQGGSKKKKAKKAGGDLGITAQKSSGPQGEGRSYPIPTPKGLAGPC